MITIEKNKVVIPKKSWNRLIKDKYFEEMLQIFIDSEILLEAMEKDNDFMNIREYDKLRRENKLSSSD